MGLGRRIRKIGSWFLQMLPPLPAFIWDIYIRWMMASPAPDEQMVDFVSVQSGEVKRLAAVDLAPCSGDAVRIIIVSDTHGRHRDISVPEGNVFLHCGDILFTSVMAPETRSIALLRDFNSWLEALPCKEKVVIGGNHDTILERLGSSAMQQLIHAAVVLNDSAITLPLAGLKIYGNPYSEGKSHNNAWQGDLHVSESCKGADVVVAHHYTPKLVESILAHAQPLLWASGHNHRKHGVRKERGMLCVNAAIVDHHYQPLNPIVVVDLPRSSVQ